MSAQQSSQSAEKIERVLRSRKVEQLFERDASEDEEDMDIESEVEDGSMSDFDDSDYELYRTNPKTTLKRTQKRDKPTKTRKVGNDHLSMGTISINGRASHQSLKARS